MPNGPYVRYAEDAVANEETVDRQVVRISALSISSEGHEQLREQPVTVIARCRTPTGTDRPETSGGDAPTNRSVPNTNSRLRWSPVAHMPVNTGLIVFLADFHTCNTVTFVIHSGCFGVVFENLRDRFGIKSLGRGSFCGLFDLFQNLGN